MNLCSLGISYFTLFVMNIKIVFILILLIAQFTTWSQTGHFAIHYTIYGKGKPVLIINGGPGMNSEGFGPLAEKIAGMGCKAIIYDQRGTGKSIGGVVNTQTITMDSMVSDIETLRVRLKIDQWVVMGHSFGGLLATHYFARHPERVEKLIFSSSGGVNLGFMSYVSQRIRERLSKSERDSMEIYQQRIDEADTSYEVRLKRAAILSKAYVYHAENAPLIAERMMQANFLINRLVFQDLRKINFDYTNAFRSSQVPVLVLQGTHDVIAVETAKEIQQSFGNAQLVLLNECGHYGWLDAGEEYLKSIDFFIINF